MKRELSGIAVVIATLAWAPNAHGQRLTEQYIPVGQSPGISGQYAYLGQIQAVDTENRTITVEGPEGARTIKVTDRTWIWLDRSQQKLTNEVGSMTDLQPGQRVEVKYVDYETRDTADWVKVVVPGTG
jgi:hypothetical protein